MRPNDSREKIRKSRQSMGNQLKQRANDKIPKFIVQKRNGIAERQKNGFTKGKIYKNNFFSDLIPLISQRLQRYAEQRLQVLGISLMSIMAHQLVDNGYSILKLNILKTIRDLEKQMIFQKYQALFNFKTSPQELVTILNSSLKLIENSLRNQQNRQKYFSQKTTQKYLYTSNDSQSYKRNCIRIHRIVIEHMRKFQISLQSLSVLVKMILMLVHYPKLDSIKQNLPPQQIYFIVCDYLDCQIEQNSQSYYFQKEHFIKQMPYHFQFGISINRSIKSKPSNSKPLFFSAYNKTASKSVQNLSFNQIQFILPSKKPITRPNTVHSPRKDSSPQFHFKSSFLSLRINPQKEIQQCESIFELGGEKSTYIEKENELVNSFDAKEGSFNLARILNTTASIYIKSDKKGPSGYLNSYDLAEIKSRYKSQFKCFRCSQKKEMSFTSNVVKIQI